MGNLWTVNQSTGNLTSSGTALFRGNVTTLGQFIGDGTQLTGVATDAELTTTSGHLQSQINSINADEVEPAIVGANGITVTSGSSTTTLTGFYAEFVSAFGSLQTQINSVQGSSGGGDKALIGAGSVAVISGSNTITISGSEVIDKEFTANTAIGQFDFVHITSSGNRVAPSIASSSDSVEVIGIALQGASAGAQFSVRMHGVVLGANTTLGFPVGVPVFLSSSVYGDGTVTPPTTTGHFILQLGHALNNADFYVNVNSATIIENTAEVTPVLTINNVSGTVTLVGAGESSISTQGQTITVNTVSKAIVGDSFLSVSSGTSTVNLSADAIVGGSNITVNSGTNSVSLTLSPTVSGLTSLTAGTVSGTAGSFGGALSAQSGAFTTSLTVSGLPVSLGGSGITDHGNLTGLADDDHLQYFRTSATSETTRIVGGNDLLFQSDGSRGTPGSNTTLTIDGATGNLDTLGTLRVRGLSGSTLFDGNVHIGNLTVTGSQTIFNSVTEVVNNLLVSGTATIGDPDTPFEDALNVRGDLNVTLDSSRAIDTVVEITHSGAAGSWDIAGTNNLWHVTNQGNAFFQNINVTGTVTGIDHGQLNGLADDDHTQYILHNGTRAFTGSIQASTSGTLAIGTTASPFGNSFITPIVPSYDTVSGTPVRGMLAIDTNNQLVAYNGSSWVILG